MTIDDLLTLLKSKLVIEIKVTLSIAEDQQAYRVDCPDCGKLVGTYKTSESARKALQGHKLHCTGREDTPSWLKSADGNSK